jgi:hypothetical protein
MAPLTRCQYCVLPKGQLRTDARVGPDVMSRPRCPVLIKTGICRQMKMSLRSMKFEENPSAILELLHAPDGRTDRHGEGNMRTICR